VLQEVSIMSKRIGCPVVRCPKNPILHPKMMPVECSAVFNAGAVRYRREYLLLLRVEDFARQVTFHVATSSNGVDFRVNPDPIRYPLREVEKLHGSYRFDMRITPLEGLYYVCHAVWLNRFGCTIGIARTKDFVDFEPLPHVSVPANRNGVLFPEKIRGLYARLERPQNTDGSGCIWVSYSPDLRYWGDSMPVAVPVNTWTFRKTGAGAVPIKTPEGWLEIYHSTATTASTENYYIGLLLLDLEDPSRIIAASSKFILQPEEVYECVGQVPNVVFTGGAIETDDGKLNIYYGGADTCVCMAQTTVRELLDFCRGR